MYHTLILFTALTLLLNGCTAPPRPSSCETDAVRSFRLSPEAAREVCLTQPEYN